MKFPTSYFDISKYIRFSNYSTRATSVLKLNYSNSPTSSTYPYSFFNRIIRLWNTAPVIDLSLSIDTIKRHLTNFFWVKFTVNFKSDCPCSFHLVCPCYRCSKKYQLTCATVICDQACENRAYLHMNFASFFKLIQRYLILTYAITVNPSGLIQKFKRNYIKLTEVVYHA